jgi:biopolymer transport protein ExbD
MATRRRQTDPGTGVFIPIVPMLDMTFQLLFFFVATFNAGTMEGQMTMNLPSTGTPKAQDPSQIDLSKQSDPELDVPSDFVVVAKSYPGGLAVSIRDNTKLIDVGSVQDLDKLKVDEQRNRLMDLMTKLTGTLKTKYEERKGQDAKAASSVKIEANSAMKYELLVSLMDACLKAGYAQVGFVPPPDQ